MPTYKITDPETGETVRLTGDSPPTEQEIEEIFAQLRPAAPVSDAVNAESPQALYPELAPPPGSTGRHPKTGLPMGPRSPALESAIPAIAGAALLGAPFAGAAGAVGALKAAGAAGLGAGAGEAFGQLASRMEGKETPTAEQAAMGIAKVGLTTALMDVGVTGGIAAAAKTVPAFFQIFLKTPAESIRRALQRPKLIPRPWDRLSDVDKAGVNALRATQAALDGERVAAGKAVQEAMKTLQEKTGGKAVVNLTPVVEAGEAALREVGSADPAVAQVLKGELSEIRRIISAIKATPVRDVFHTWKLRQAIDSLTDFKRGGLQPVSSDPAKRVVASIAQATREAIDDVAETYGVKALAQANEKFHSVSGVIDQYRDVFSTKGLSDLSMVRRLRRLAADFNRGGLEQEFIQGAGAVSKAAQKAVDNLLDAVAARAFVDLPIGTPSGMTKDFAIFAKEVSVMLGAPKVIIPVAGVTARGARAVAPQAGALIGGRLAAPTQEAP